MANNESPFLKVLRCDTLTSDEDSDPQMDTSLHSSQRKRTNRGSSPTLTPPARKRRPKNDEMTVREKVMGTLRGIISELQATCLDRDNKITKFAAEKVLEHAGALQDLVVELLTDYKKLQGKLDKQTEILATSQQISASPVTYASVAKTAVTGSRAVTRAGPVHKRPLQILFIRPEDPSAMKDSEEVQQTFTKIVDPRKTLIKFRQMRKLKNKGLLLEVERQEDVKKLIGNSQLKERGLKAQLMDKRNPRVIIYDVPKYVEKSELLGVITTMNEELFKQSNPDEFKLIFKTGKRRVDMVNWVAEVSPQMRDRLINQQRLYVDYTSCKVKDFLAISRCFRCQSYGHVAKYCKDEEDTCSHCTDRGHKYSECPKRKEPAQCAACKRVGKPHNHNRTSKQCAAFKMASERYRNSIAYS
ncbi:uncharacterized protein LOC111634911 [Centruroides sculpturatus]|uniref:uncharacterized protein LOC111634911 n=1 Tax=Centruroides sculpturatus TaxID=218467 RepID=UPI000C6E3EF3|nr:uncharacterized protein LOC111634911 [Centruroides sculpturatus]